MPTELSMVLWMRRGVSCVDRLSDLQGAINGWDAFDGAWSPRAPGPGVAAVARPARVQLLGGEPGGAYVGIDAWDDDHRHHPDEALDGHAQVWMRDIRPFRYPARPDQVPAWEANLEAVLQLLGLLIAAPDVRRIAVYSEGGDHHPLNAHALWTADGDAAVDDDALLRRLWTVGAPDRGLPPLRSPATPAQDGPLHPWRPREAREALWRALGQWVDGPGGPVFPAAGPDVYRRGAGLLRMSYPCVFEGFVSTDLS